MMRSILSESISWIKGSKYGYTYKDKIVLFLYISNAIIIIIFIIGIFGKNKLIDTYFKRTYLLNWIPVKSVLVKIDGAILSLPMILDYIILVKPDWEEKEREFMTQLNLNNNNNNAIVMDIGANIGIYTILLSHIYPKAKIIAIEASPTIFEMLRSNCKLNNLVFSGSNVLLINKAISDKDDITTEFYEKHSMSTMLKEFLTNLSSTILSNQDELNKRVIRTITIDNLVETININEISLLKIDVEGAEVLALKGAIKTLTQKKIKNMIIEYHSLENYNYIVKLLEEEELGYTIVNSQERFNKEKEFVNGHIMAILQE
ncbi:MAG TPA: FkbM family methyltransferase [Nitrososphaeraceae archaeon]|nr:FkbM family methyltransferase [Nitrososphaeraceae archaeon]